LCSNGLSCQLIDDVDELFVPDEKKLNTSMEIGEGIAAVPTGAVESNENDVDVNCVASSSPVDNTLTSNCKLNC